AGPFTAGTWPVDITEAVTIKAVGGTATVNAGSHTGFQIDPSAVLGASDTVRLEGLSITGDGVTPDPYCVHFTGAYEGPSDAALKNLVVTGTTGTAPASADNGIQIAGFDPADHSVDHAIGNVSFDNVSVNGTYEKNLVYAQGYDNFNGLDFANGLTLGDGGSQ